LFPSSFFICQAFAGASAGRILGIYQNYKIKQSLPNLKNAIKQL
jgi:hypothetical protein